MTCVKNIAGLILGLGLVAQLMACAAHPGLNGQRMYDQHCAGCHGATGAGDGPRAAGLSVPPANLRGIAAANGGEFPRQRVMATIHGYRGRSLQHPMPEFEDALRGDTVIWTSPDGERIETPQALIDLTDYVESLQDLPGE